MTPTPRQREEWEINRNLLLEKTNDEIEYFESRIQESQVLLEILKKDRDNLMSRYFEDSYFDFLAERGSEK